MFEIGNGIVVGVADMAIGGAEQGHLITYALGSCIGLSAYDPVARLGGLLHYMLPQPAESGGRTRLQPFVYATTGIPLLLQKLLEAGAEQDRLVVCAAGGAEIHAAAAAMAIGKRNRTMLQKTLGSMGITLAAEETGGRSARTMTLDLVTGEVRIRRRHAESVLSAPNITGSSAKAMAP